MPEASSSAKSPFWWVRWVPAGLLVLVAAYLVVWAGRAVFVPLLASLAITFVLEPVVTWFEKRGLSRNLAVLASLATATLLVLLVLGLLLPSVWYQVEASIARLPAALRAGTDLLNQAVAYIEGRFGHDAIVRINAYLAEIRDDPSAITSRVGVWLYSGAFELVGATSTILGLLIVPFFVYYLLLDLERIRAGIESRIPPRFRGAGSQLFDEIGVVVRGYVQGRVLVALCMAVIYALGLWILGVPLWAGIGLIAGFVGIVPYLGVMSGFVLAIAFAALDSAGVGRLVGVGCVFVVAQMIEDYVLTPRLIGDKLELHPMLVFIALIVAGDLFGLLGLVLAIPLVAVFKVLFTFFDELYQRSDFYNGRRAGDDVSAEKVRGAVAATTGPLVMPAAAPATPIKRRVTEGLKKLRRP